MLEKEIISRQSSETIEKLLQLLKSNDEYLRVFGLDMLIHFDSNDVIQPILELLTMSNNDFHNKRAGMFAISKYNDARVKNYLISEYNSNIFNEDKLYRWNYLVHIERVLKDQFSIICNPSVLKELLNL